MATLGEMAAACNSSAQMHGQAGSAFGPYGAAGGVVTGCLIGIVGADAQKQAAIDAQNRVLAQQRGDQQTAVLNLLAQQQEQATLAQQAALAQQMPTWVVPAGIGAAALLVVYLLLTPKKKVSTK